MQRMRLRTALIAVAALAILLGIGVGLRRRAGRLEALSLSYSGKAGGLEFLLMEPGYDSPGERVRLMERVHWHDAVAAAYRRAADRPWLPVDPDPQQVTCDCNAHRSHNAGTIE